jgi:hypothetical protein
MRVIVNDSSALIDLKKGGLLEVVTSLPAELLVSDAMLEDELLSFTKAEVALMRKKMRVVTLVGAEVRALGRLQAESPALSFHDCAALIIARRERGCILLTGDRRLRAKAELEEIECHGVLWIVEELEKSKTANRRKLLTALEAWREDVNVRLPRSEIAQAIARLKR